MTPEAALRACAEAERVNAPVALVAAHPDDETLGLGGRMGRFSRLTVVHVTDGAPLDPSDALRAGFADGAAYAAAREVELAAALAAAGAGGARRVGLGVQDQAVWDDLPGLVTRLAEVLRGQAVVISHPYEGGHPDHDGVALAVQAACARLGPDAPVRLEFAGYHRGSQGQVSGAFCGDPGVACRLEPADVARKRAALACFASQAGVLAVVGREDERLRIAPDYDFAAAPTPDGCLYDGYGWAVTGEVWRTRARVALASVGKSAAHLPGAENDGHVGHMGHIDGAPRQACSGPVSIARR